nr:unnamed protein product [Digitaria exilis]
MAPIPNPIHGLRLSVELELELPPSPGGSAPFDLAAAVCSHGLFMMAPNRWDPAARALVRPLRLASDSSVSVLARISAHPARPGAALLVAVQRAGDLSSRDQDYILEQVRRMLRLSEEDGAAVAEFQAMHAAAREAGFGRIFRSPTLSEDMVKCILLCNCQLKEAWGGSPAGGGGGRDGGAEAARAPPEPGGGGPPVDGGGGGGVSS